MYQTFYIDADEEISSVIDKLNKSVSTENYFVVPKRAIFLQSIVNLKLLKREAEKLNKKLTIVTQDEIGASMAKRSGLEVKQSIEGLDSEEIEDVFHDDENDKDLDFYDPEVVIDKYDDKKSRLEAVGSSEFFDSMDINNRSKKETKNPDIVKSQSKKISINGILTRGKKENLQSGRGAHHDIIKSNRRSSDLRSHLKPDSEFSYKNKIDSEKEKNIEKMFAPSRPQKQENLETQNISSGSSKKIFIGFIISCVLVFAGVATYLFLPSAKISVVPNVLNDKLDVVIYGNSETSQVDKVNIPIRIIEKEETFSLSYNVAGVNSGTGKKARGTIVIYNEFNNSPQTLVATTRFESSNGKIFRLVKNIVVPGTTVIGSETKPGAIEAEVIADQSGDDFNIDPASFSIPGFKDGPKFEKFYGKSKDAFVGGSSEGGSSTGAVAQSDIDSAKQKAESSLKEKIANTVKEELKEDEILLEQAEKISITKTGTKARVGDMTNVIEYNVTASVRAFIFSQKDINSVIKNSIKDRENLKNANWDVSKIEYGVSVADFEKNTIELKIHSEILITPIIDIEKIKEELLGKKDDELSAALKDYSSIKTVNVEFQPTIISRIPQYSWRVNIEIEKKPE